VNPETAHALLGEGTLNLAPYVEHMPVLRRPDATGEIPVHPEPARQLPAERLDTGARPGQGRHRQALAPRSWQGLVIAALTVAVVALAVTVGWLVTR
jgi:hypothetical protein